MKDILSRIIEDKKLEIERHKSQCKLETMKSLAAEITDKPSFLEALVPLSNSPLQIIAECKKASPSKGVISQNYNPVELAQAYERGGASCVSVLTDETYFKGSLQDLKTVSQAVKIPVLRKDFILDEYQIWQARANGASSFLLLAAALNTYEIQYFIEIGREMDMEPLVECHNEAELETVLSTDAKIVGINNRNLRSFEVNYEQSIRLYDMATKLSRNRIIVSESGIKSRYDIEKLAKTGYKAFLIGETLVKSENPELLVKELSRKY